MTKSSTQSAAIIKLEVACTALSEAKTLQEVIHVRDTAKVAQEYAKRAAMSREAEQYAAEIRIRAERKAGEFLQRIEKAKGTRGNIQEQLSGSNIMLPPEDNPTLSDLGIQKMESSRWQKIASLPEPEFEQAITDFKGRGKDITQNAFLQLAKDHKNQQLRAQRSEAADKIAFDDSLSSSKDIAVNPGDVWRLGDHRLHCIDSSEWDFDGPAKLAFADPPYNVGVDEWDKEFKWSHDWLEQVADYVLVTPGTSQISSFLKGSSMHYKWMLTNALPGVYGRHSAIGTSNTINALLFSEFESVHLGISDYNSCSFSQSEKGESDHKGRKPKDFIGWLIQSFTLEGDLVIDPFLGSGTTLLMAENLNRVCFGCEILPRYCKEIICRWENMTSQKAELLRT